MYDGYYDECDGCTCCCAGECHTGERSGCPADSLGDSVCPCTEAF